MVVRNNFSFFFNCLSQVPLSDCDFIVDLDSPVETPHEPRYSQKGWMVREGSKLGYFAVINAGGNVEREGESVCERERERE